ncbi:hypothetical protein COY43_00940 [Candidatus Berkelbacteria bacterium CG_4_10_14_0_8_um_filter_35_9_33_8]|nr:MAG: hypothetical protein COX10_02200 [Candidatus Berkelbacteria bacterium CG23_combo_of_CG06-09_8_20_14_all_33_15]PIS08243.1 MAG: hypothetical protein COT76_02500 [Candidatus Berkelbacteria bacterium CG10_big_fil_rev_8_21_14_0_10_33_10]PIZ28351.1 MAG: hypothetical protein COY43_00940 [Candidatus Berkelbacteria bacterium CG_4_10_14_0_8_um_filter_35_9_33_8]
MLEETKTKNKDKPSIVKDFYGEVDKIKKRRGSFCTCYSFAIFIIVIIIILSVFIVLGLKKISNPSVTNVKLVEPSQQALDSLKSKLSNLVQQNDQNKGETVSLTVTEGELTSLLSQNKEADFPVKDITAEINVMGIKVRGKYQKDLLVVKNISVAVVVDLEPSIKDEKLQVTVKQIEAGDLKLNKTVSSRIGKNLENIFDQKINRDDIIFESVVLSNGQMTLSGRQK